MESDNKVHIANVKLGPQYGNDWIVESGLQPGARVVTDNLQKLRDGETVAPRETSRGRTLPPPAPRPPPRGLTMSKFFIRRPIVAIVIAILTVIIGLVSMLTLPTSQYPDIVPPEIQVQAIYPGADAKTLAEAVSTPIEQQMNGVDNMFYMYSVNANNGQATVYVDFDVKSNADTDQVLSQLRVSQAQAQLPVQVNAAGVTVQKSFMSPLMLIGLSSPGNKYSADFLTNYAIINLQDELTRVPGVSRVQIFGGQYALRVWVKPDQLAKLGVTATEIISAIQTQNNVNPAGKIGGEPRTRRPAVHLHGAHAGPPGDARGIRQHRHPRQPRRLHPAPPRRSAH